MYAKIFASLWQGTMYGKPHEQLVFVYLLAHSDRHGVVDIHPEIICACTGLDIATVTRCLAYLEAADFKSRSDDLQGQRIVRLDEHREWGWQVVNYLKYRNIRDEDTRREQVRQAQARQRDKRSVITSHHESSQSAHADADAEVDAEADKDKHLVPDGTVRAKVDPEKAKAAKDWRESFDEYFWPAYLPLRSGLPNPKADALAVWLRVKNPSQEVFESVASELDSCVKSWADTEPRYIPHARKWLHERIRNGVFYPTGGA